MKKPKTLKDVWYCYTGHCNSMCVQQATPAIQKMVKKWIKFLESESFKVEPGYRVKWNQAQILKEIFDIHE